MAVDADGIGRFVEGFWDRDILPTLKEYIEIPCLSLDFDPGWEQSGHLHQARQLALEWLRARIPADWTLHDETLPGRTPLILLEVPGTTAGTTLIYGHLDKQPEMEGWFPGFGPWVPVVDSDRLYGRGGADDGYALFSAVAALKALQAQGAGHPRVVVLIEFSEESGSPDLPAYIDHYGEVIGAPELVIALDSGAGDYQRLWSTTSLRGMLSATVSVQVLEQATHSGIASGVVPCSMRIMRLLLDRLEDPRTGALRVSELEAEIPAQRREQAAAAAAVLPADPLGGFSAVPGLRPVADDPVELLLNNTWRPTLSVVGQQGLPAVREAGNVLRACTTLKLSFRLPPTVACATAQAAIRRVLTHDPPYGAQVDVHFDQCGNGWDAPALAPWLEQAAAAASRAFYGEEAAYFGLGASIPFISMLGERFPEAQFLITGVLGPNSNAHGPNEFLHIPYAKRLTACIAHILGGQAAG